MLVQGFDEAVANFVSAGLGAVISPPFIALGIVHGDRIVGGYILSEFNHANIELTAYAPGLMRRGHLRFLANYIFGQLGCKRISAHTHRKNKLTLRTLEKAGFKYEATLKGFYPTGDAVLFGMQRANCRWLT
jgi:RimJ/RimL family protein N-acetyltransferase